VAIAWKDLIVDFNHLDSREILAAWQWLIGPNKLPILLSSVGDAFLQDIGDGSIS